MRLSACMCVFLFPANYHQYSVYDFCTTLRFNEGLTGLYICVYMIRCVCVCMVSAWGYFGWGLEELGKFKILSTSISVCVYEC